MTTQNAASDWEGVDFASVEKALQVLAWGEDQTYELVQSFYAQVQEVRRKQLANEPSLLRKEV